MTLDKSFLQELNIEGLNAPVTTGTQSFGNFDHKLDSYTPVDGSLIASCGRATLEDYERLIQTAKDAFTHWRQLPAPQRGEIIRQYGEELRKAKKPLGQLVSLEMGKSLQEGLGEVQEMIDICDFAVGLSRQLYGKTMHSERPYHRMYEQWHPLGLVGIISAFNFPVAVWSWNAMIAAVCGDVTIWKPSEKTPLCAIACFQLLKKVLVDNKVPEGVFNLIIGDVNPIGETLIHDRRIPLISATGSTRMGRRVGEVVGQRLGKSLLELGGNNAIILTPSADLQLALPAIVFGAVGTCGQRCTSTRRLLVPENLYADVKAALVKAYSGLKIGNPLDMQNHVGPLIDRPAVQMMTDALKKAQEQGGKVLHGGEPIESKGFYVRPALVEISHDAKIVHEETFAPILYLLKYSGDLKEAIAIQNGVDHGLSSSVFTSLQKDSEQFLSAWGSDCGIANVNIGTSGAEIGGAFGGEKDTGGGRESGSDAWRVYMRRQTNTINFSDELPLAQGIKFDL